MNANAFLQKDYENEPPSGLEKTNPIKANFRKAKMNLKSLAGKSGHTRLIADVKKTCKMQGHEDNGGNGRLSA